jgi:hypothetical protein
MNMSGTLVIASRELRERSRIFLMAAAMAVLPFLAALVPAARNDRAMVIAGVGGFVAVALAVGLAVAQGSSTIAGELVARRMSFYFSKPVSPAAIWFGKLVAAMLTSALCFAIVAGPAFLATGSQWQRVLGGWRLLQYFGGLTLALFLFSHVVATMVRSRSGLIAIDFVLAAIAGGATYLIVRPLYLAGSSFAPMISIAIGVAVALIALVAPVWQLARGRSDIKRSHAALSQALWIPVAGVLVIAAVYAGWLVYATPSTLKTFQRLEQAPGGTFFIAGEAHGDYRAAFLADMNTGKYARIAAAPWYDVVFSEDGRRVAWLQALWRAGTIVELEVYTQRLDQPGAQPKATGIRKGSGSFALSPNGSRLAVLGDTISVHDLDARRILASARRNPRAFTVAVCFASPDVVRVYQGQNGSPNVTIWELDTRTKAFVQTGAVTTEAGHYNGIRTSRDGSRILFPRSGIVADSRTGAVIGKVPLTTPNIFSSAILGNDTVVVFKRDTPRVTLAHFFALDGAPLRTMSLPAHFAWISGETSDGKLIAIGYDKINDGETGRGRKMFVIDPASGTIVRTLNDIKGPTPNFSETRLRRFAANDKLAAVNADGKLVTWVPATGAVTKFEVR